MIFVVVGSAVNGGGAIAINIKGAGLNLIGGAGLEAITNFYPISLI